MPDAACAFFKASPAARRVKPLRTAELQDSKTSEPRCNNSEDSCIGIRKVGEAKLCESQGQVMQDREDSALKVGNSFRGEGDLYRSAGKR